MLVMPARIEKAKKYPPGTVRRWRDGKDRVKTTDGKWKEVSRPKGIVVRSPEREYGSSVPKREYDEIKRRYQGTPLWMKTPNGEPTNLTERQWIQVRTPSFKKWFGDWEITEKINHVLEMDSVCNLTGDEFRPDGVRLTEKIPDYFRTEFNNIVVNKEIGAVVLDKEGVKDSIAHGISRVKASAFAAVHDVIKKGVIVDHKENYKNRGYDTYVIAAPITMKGVEYIEEVVVNKRPNTQKYYLHEVIIKERLQMEFKTATESGSTEAYSILSKIIADVKKNPSSKVVDENGEPLVVYHGTNVVFNAFSKELLGTKNIFADSASEGFFFAGTRDTSLNYTGMNQMDLTGLQLTKDPIVTTVYDKYHEELDRIDGKKRAIRDTVRAETLRDYDAERPNLIKELMDFGLSKEQAEKQRIEIYTSLYGEMNRDRIEKDERYQALEEEERRIKEKILVEIEADWMKNKGLKPNIMELHLSLKNPMVVDAGNKRAGAEINITRHIRDAKSKGHDGVIFTNMADGGGYDDIFVAFKPNQIKSATGNQGTFDKNNADIRKSIIIRRWYDPLENRHGETKFQYPYGYIRLTEGEDGDHVDCFLRPDRESPHVFIVRQNDPTTGLYDEDKVMRGSRSMEIKKGSQVTA